jgi:hypothetical protein
MAEKLVALNLLSDVDGETTSAEEEQSTIMVVPPTALRARPTSCSGRL